MRIPHTHNVLSAAPVLEQMQERTRRAFRLSIIRYSIMAHKYENEKHSVNIPTILYYEHVSSPFRRSGCCCC